MGRYLPAPRLQFPKIEHDSLLRYVIAQKIERFFQSTQFDKFHSYISFATDNFLPRKAAPTEKQVRPFSIHYRFFYRCRAPPE